MAKKGTTTGYGYGTGTGTGGVKADRRKVGSKTKR